MDFVAKMKRVAESVGMACFVLLALYGTLTLVRGAPAWAAGRTQEGTTATDSESVMAAVEPDSTTATGPLLSYQGELRDASGNPLNGPYNLTFRIYGSPVGTDPFYSEEHTNVQVRDGRFTVLLGEIRPLYSGLFRGTDRYIGITVDSDAEMVPRQRLVSVPFAIQASHATALRATDGDPIAVFVDNIGNVGIGTTNPQDKLDIYDGSLRFSGTVGQIGITHQSTGNFGPTSKIFFDDIWDDGANSRVHFFSRNAGNDFSEVFRTGADGWGNYVSAFPVGRVGIGRLDPQATLDVKGSISAMAIESRTYTNWGAGCHDTDVYGLPYMAFWDPGGQGEEGTNIEVISGLANLRNGRLAQWGAGWAGPNPIQVCVGGGKAYVDSITIYYIPFTGYR